MKVVEGADIPGVEAEKVTTKEISNVSHAANMVTIPRNVGTMNMRREPRTVNKPILCMKQETLNLIMLC